MYSDAQCSCSAQFVSDIMHILDGPAAALNVSGTDFQQYFEPKCMDGFDTCKPPLQTLICSAFTGPEYAWASVISSARSNKP